LAAAGAGTEAELLEHEAFSLYLYAGESTDSERHSIKRELNCELACEVSQPTEIDTSRKWMVISGIRSIGIPIY
jgi:hypothetical protein